MLRILGAPVTDPPGKIAELILFDYTPFSIYLQSPKQDDAPFQTFQVHIADSLSHDDLHTLWTNHFSLNPQSSRFLLCLFQKIIILLKTPHLLFLFFLEAVSL